ncbi:Gmad2 immunoglobulin-like domain-containing protein [Jiangella asiatica]|uniref:GerMN domain-containing protein n=1 Tax=Jiangella asiatica TaxID=2530372 RepID=A0A4R5CU84_9ACTN|nr:Gmad2 immunoglobulin-like domain-containing protein [Jiangella asiatica]TDE01303.1 hypothetical protein E1269_23360 [Jiangella asiatica]
MNTPDDLTPEERRLHDALHRAAEQVEPGPDGLARIRRRTAVVPLWRRPVVLGLAGATALAVAVLIGGVVALNGSDDDPIATTTSTPSRTPAETPSTPPSPSGGETTPGPDPTPSATGPVETITVPVYFVADSGAGSRLAREFQTIESADPPVLAALRQVASPTDPDYTSLWQSGLIRSAEVGDDAITVDLTALPEITRDSGEPSAAELAVQQVVYTATAAAATFDLDGSLPVRITVEGEAVDALGEVPLTEPVPRAEPLDVRQVMQLNEPTEGATVTSPVTVRGEAATFEANVPWEIRRDGEVVDEGAATATECCTFAEFEFQVDLEPGTYEVVITEDDPSGGEGRPPMSDSRTFTVE